MIVLDYFSPHPRDVLACFKQNADGIARYLTNSPSDQRQITPQEVADAHDVGLSIYFFYEMNPTYPAYFTYTQGAEDCHQAQARLTELGAPDGTVVYFAVDANVEPSLTTGYFNGIESVATPRITPGLYGFQRMCEYAKAMFPGIGRHLWQTYGIPTITLDGFQHLQESRCGVSVDVNDVTVPGWKGNGVSAPTYVGQSVTNVSLTVGQVGQIDGIWHYPSGDRHIVEKVYALAPGFWPYTMYPPADPDADPTKVLNAQPAYFVIAVR